MANSIKSKIPDESLGQEVRRRFLEACLPGQFCEALFELLPSTHFFLKDAQGRFVSASAGFAKIMGAESVSAILGKTDYDFTADFLANAFVKDDDHVLRTGKSILNKVELVPVQSSLDWLTTSKIPVYGRDGTVIGLAGVVRRTEDSDPLYRANPVVHRIVDYIGQNHGQKVSVREMASQTGISESTVERLFRKTFGISPMRYVKKVRLHAACTALRASSRSVAQIAYESGFNDPSGMSRAFREELKISPRQYRARFKSGPRRK